VGVAAGTPCPRRDDELGAEMVGDGVADHRAVPGVDDDAQIDATFVGGVLGDVGVIGYGGVPLGEPAPAHTGYLASCARAAIDGTNK